MVFILEPDNGVFDECSVWDQDCPLGDKCNPWANDGGTSWNAWRCSEIDDDPGAHGDDCEVEGSGVSGIDDCDIGVMCFSVDPETNMGTCIDLCIGPEATPTCNPPATSCVITNDGWLPLCLPNCDPLIQDCNDGDGCYPVEGAFVCAPDASGDEGVEGDNCDFINVCDPGLMCAEADLLPSCFGSGCCTPYCDTSDAACPDDETTCVPFFEDGEEPPGYENVGTCLEP